VLENLWLPLVGVHILRHSAVAALIRSGASPTAVQKILGHRSAAFTLTVYGHIFEADSDVVAENLERNWTEGDASQGRLTLARLKPRRSAGT
jgi:integrase